MAEQQPAIVMQAEQKKASPTKLIAGIVLITVIITLGFYGYSYATSDIGRQKIADIKYSVSTKYNPFAWYGEQLKEAGELGKIWETEPSKEAEEIGIKFKDFETVGSGIVPSGALLAFMYKFDVGEGVYEVPLSLSCNIEAEGKKYLSEEDIVESKDIKPAENPKISTDNPISYSNILCQVNTKKRSEDTRIVAEGKVGFPFKQRGSLKVYFTKDTVNIGKKFFEKYNIKESLPIRAKYNNEPVELGLGVSDENIQPVIIGENQFPAVGISLKNRWNGKVTKITDMNLILPKGVKIDEANSPPSILCPFEKPTSTDAYVKYKAKGEYLEQVSAFGKGMEELQTAQRFFCWLEIDESVLEGKPYNDKEYSADVSYEYEFKPDSVTVTLKGVEGAEEEIKETKYYLCQEEGKYSCITKYTQGCEETAYTKEECENELKLYL